MSEQRGEVAERRLHLGGREIRVLEKGAGPPVVLVHGLGLTAGVWRPHIELLAAAGYHAVAPDLPGFGHSEGPWTGQSVPRTAAWLSDFGRRLGLGAAAWVGHSVGAQQVLRLAVDHPAQAGALVLAAPTGRAGRHGVAQIVGLATDAFRERPGLVTGVLRRYVLRPLSAVGTWARSLRHESPLDAPRAHCPVLLVEGAKDPLVRPEFLHLLQRLLPDAEIHEIEEAGHAVALDPPAPFTQAVLEFLDRRYRPG